MRPRSTASVWLSKSGELMPGVKQSQKGKVPGAGHGTQEAGHGAEPPAALTCDAVHQHLPLVQLLLQLPDLSLLAPISHRQLWGAGGAVRREQPRVTAACPIKHTHRVPRPHRACPCRGEERLRLSGVATAPPGWTRAWHGATGDGQSAERGPGHSLEFTVVNQVFGVREVQHLVPLGQWLH